MANTCGRCAASIGVRSAVNQKGRKPMSDVKIRAKAVIKIETPNIDFTHEYRKGTSVKRLAMDMASYVVVDEGADALREAVELLIQELT
jgi:hypothetical protein